MRTSCNAFRALIFMFNGLKAGVGDKGNFVDFCFYLGSGCFDWHFISAAG